jgi:hypothetical protein
MKNVNLIYLALIIQYGTNLFYLELTVAEFWSVEQERSDGAHKPDLAIKQKG